MAEKETKTAEEKLDAIASHLDSLHKKMDSWEEEKKADRAKLDAACEYMDKTKRDAAEKDEKEKSDKLKADAEAKEKEAKEKEEKEKADRAKADAAQNVIPPAVQAALEEIQRDLPAVLTPENRKLFTDVQFRAEPVYQAFGDSAGAPAPLRGEALPDYQRRLLTKFKSHSPRWKDKDLTKVDASVLDIAEEHIYADAMQAAAHPADLPAGTLRTIKKTDHSGRNIFEFLGDEKAAWAHTRNGGFTGRFVRPH